MAEPEAVYCKKCGKKLGVVGDGYMYIRYRGRSIKISPTSGECKVNVTCDGKLCNETEICIVKALTRKGKADNIII